MEMMSCHKEWRVRIKLSCPLYSLSLQIIEFADQRLKRKFSCQLQSKICTTVPLAARLKSINF